MCLLFGDYARRHGIAAGKHAEAHSAARINALHEVARCAASVGLNVDGAASPPLSARNRDPSVDGAECVGDRSAERSAAAQGLDMGFSLRRRQTCQSPADSHSLLRETVRLPPGLNSRLEDCVTRFQSPE